MNIATFSRQHIPQTLRLSTQVGWNHIEQDWQRCLDLSPDFCLAGFDQDQLIATTTLTRFGDLGWIGTFLVDNAHQRKGHGSAMLQAAIDRAKAIGIDWFALDSSEVGRPIYNKFGFVLDEPIERWTGPNVPAGKTATEKLIDTDWIGIMELDRESSGVDRANQLRHLANEPGAAVRVLKPAGMIEGFGFSRPGRVAGSIGPVVARTEDAARQVMDALLGDRRQLDGDRAVAMDLLGHGNIKAFMSSKGFIMRRQNIRMYLPVKRRPVLTGQNIYAATGLGMG